jgi:hypothetical protein
MLGENIVGDEQPAGFQPPRRPPIASLEQIGRDAAKDDRRFGLGIADGETNGQAIGIAPQRTLDHHHAQPLRLVGLDLAGGNVGWRDEIGSTVL